MRKFLTLVSFTGLMLMGSCYYDVEQDLYPQDPCETQNMSFANDIKPIIDQYCVSCHSGANPSASIDLSDYPGVKAIADNGLLQEVISRPNGDPTLMPPSGKLSDCRIRKINSWVIDGAQPN